MALSYSEALDILMSVAQEISANTTDKHEIIALHDAVGREVAQDYFAEASMPLFDTAAMDGFAICASHTAKATPENPVKFEIKGTCGAGDPCMSVAAGVEGGIPPCVEIMTGAPFPREQPGSASLDACVKLEDTQRKNLSGYEYIEISCPVSLWANRRPAGSDIPHGAKIVSKGQVIRSSHIMPLAALGITQLRMKRVLKVGVWSTGKEIFQSSLQSSSVNDINGPYLIAAFHEHGVEASFLGTIGDSKEEIDCFVQSLKEVVDSEAFDVLVTTGGVSVGRFDFVHGALSQAKARMHFHGLSIRPGHPVMFSSWERCMGRRIAFFGLPGNPGATAATFKFLVLPFLSGLKEHNREQPVWASLHDEASRKRDNKEAGFQSQSRKEIDCFRHGFVSNGESGRTVKLSLEQSPSKVFPFVQANCWVHIPPEFDPMNGTRIACFNLFPGSITT